jgi:hypothetical protein
VAPRAARVAVAAAGAPAWRHATRSSGPRGNSSPICGCPVRRSRADLCVTAFLIYGPLVGSARDVAGAACAFDWPVEFPDVMAGGGFDVVLGTRLGSASSFRSRNSSALAIQRLPRRQRGGRCTADRKAEGRRAGRVRAGALPSGRSTRYSRVPSAPPRRPSCSRACRSRTTAAPSWRTTSHTRGSSAFRRPSQAASTRHAHQA